MWGTGSDNNKKCLNFIISKGPIGVRCAKKALN